MANENNKIKLLLLWDILSKNTDENHAMNSDEIREELAKRGISVMRKVVATDIAALSLRRNGYEYCRQGSTGNQSDKDGRKSGKNQSGGVLQSQYRQR